jgi:hypothetical protein
MAHQLVEPEEDVATAVSAGDPAASPDRENDPPSRRDELARHLNAALAGTHDEDPAGRQVRLAAVVMDVELLDVGRQIRGDRG